MTKSPSKLPPLRLALLALCLFPALLLLAGAAATTPPAFSHKLHVGEQEIPCKSCHDTGAAAAAGSPDGLPALKTRGCGKCHEDGPPEWKGPTARKLGVKFPHVAHAAKADCATCHQDVLEDAHDGKAPLVDPKACGTCHAGKKVALPESACARCHGTDVRAQKPADHDATWARRHGPESQWRVHGDHGRSCTDCHRPSTCNACHDQQRPADHNGLWRVRAHGLSAGWDRDRCKTCHETGTCIRCHQTTAPVSHTAGWRQTHGLVAGGRTNETCNVCHQPGWCAACHAGR